MMEYETQQAIDAMAKETNTAALARRVLNLQTSDKFRLAAALLDLGKAGTAEAVGTRACQEIQLANLFVDKSKAVGR
jgi:hypothetical protein